MRRLAIGIGLLVTLAMPASSATPLDAAQVIDKALKALGGEKKLRDAKAFLWKVSAKLNMAGLEGEFKTEALIEGPDRAHLELEGVFAGSQAKIVTVINETKGSRDMNGNKAELNKEQINDEKRNVYLLLVPTVLLPLKTTGFKVELLGEEKVNDKPATGVKVTAPDQKDFTLYFDKETGLPAKLLAAVKDFTGAEFLQEIYFLDYKEMAGIRKAARLQFFRDKQMFMEQHVTEFQRVEKVDPNAFAIP